MEIKLYTENSRELRERFEKAEIKLGRDRCSAWEEADYNYLYANSVDEEGIVQGNEPGCDNCTHATADEFFDAVCKWFGVEVKEEPEWKNWTPGKTMVLASDSRNALYGGYLRIWLGYFNGLHLTVHYGYEKNFLNGEFFETITWKFAKLPEPLKLPEPAKLTRKQIAAKFGISDDFEIVEE